MVKKGKVATGIYILDNHIPHSDIADMSELKTYLKRNSIKQADFAKQIGVGQATVSKLTSGVMSPRLEVAAKIERATNGAVLAVSWVREKPQAKAS